MLCHSWMDRLDDAWNSSPVSRTPAKFVYISLVSIVSFATVFLHLLKYCWICCKVFSIQMGRSCQLTLQSLHPFPSLGRQQSTINIPQIRSHHSCQLATRSASPEAPVAGGFDPNDGEQPAPMMLQWFADSRRIGSIGGIGPGNPLAFPAISSGNQIREKWTCGVAKSFSRFTIIWPRA